MLYYTKKEISSTYMPAMTLLVYHITPDETAATLNTSVIDNDIQTTKNIGGICLDGDTDKTKYITEIGQYIHETYPLLTVVWFTERCIMPYNHGVFDYIKLGDSTYPITDEAHTEQRMYQNLRLKPNDYANASFADITSEMFWSPEQYDPTYYDYKESRRERVKKELADKGLITES